MDSYSVSEFIDFLNTALGTAVFPEGAVIEGEVTEYRLSQGKWIWFVLKDDTSTISCFATVWGLRQPLADGMLVRAYGRPKVHPKSGRFSFNVAKVEPVGEGALRRSFEMLRQRLEKEGLFAAERKRPLPVWPEQIGLITSAESAAYGDFLRIMNNRWGGLRISLADVQVQGRSAAEQIAAAFEWFNRSVEPPVEAIVLIRGGGSLEDLQAFNTEEVCRAVFGSRVPVLVGVGHERDISLADLAADQRASTPSNAAEILVPNRQEVAESLSTASYRLNSAIRDAVAAKRLAVSRSVEHLDQGRRQPVARLGEMTGRLRGQADRLTGRLVRRQIELSSARDRLVSGLDHRMSRLQVSLAGRQRLLESLDPRRLLRQGYAIVRHQGRVLKAANAVSRGDRIAIQLASGELAAEVTDNHRYEQRKQGKQGQKQS